METVTHSKTEDCDIGPPYHMHKLLPVSHTIAALVHHSSTMAVNHMRLYGCGAERGTNMHQ